MNSSVIGIIIATTVGYFTLSGTTNDMLHYFNVHGLLIVLGGTISVSIIGFKIKELWFMTVRLLRVFSRKPVPAEKVVEQIIKLSRIQSRGHVLTTENVSSLGLHPFLLDGIRYIENSFSSKEITEILTSTMRERKDEFSRQIDMVNAIAKYPPAFGMIGTVLGLIALMYGLGDKGATSRIGPNMAVALVATLYGLVMSNYVFQPLSDNLHDRLKKDLHLRRIIARGILLLQSKEDPILVFETLNAFLLPSQRLKDDHGQVSASNASGQGRAA